MERLAAVSSAWHRRITLAVVVVGVGVLIAFVLTFAAKDQLAGDFGLGLYPQAQGLIETGRALEPAGTPIYGENTVYTILTTLLATPATLIPLGVAVWVATIASVALLLGALLVLGVRDARVFGIVLVWEPVLSAVQTAQVTPVLVFLLACAVAQRKRPELAGAIVGVACAVKLLVVPFAAWVIALRHPRAFFTLAGVAVLLGPVLFLPFGSPLEYVDLLRRTAHTYEGATLSPYVLLGADGLARGIVVATGIAIAAFAAVSNERRSIPLAIAACILLSPIVWQHYYALLLVPLAALRPRFGPLWVVPLAMWVAPFANASTWQLIVVMAVFAVVTGVLAFRPDQPGTSPSLRTAEQLNDP